MKEVRRQATILTAVFLIMITMVLSTSCTSIKERLSPAVTDPKVLNEPCNVNYPCVSGYSCIQFYDKPRPYCAKPQPCDYYCDDDAGCQISNSNPAYVQCS